jgi:2-polyprenyl-3-methyl-5-hydroxy-6-metoxy-1,4-benzoquinol methylase
MVKTEVRSKCCICESTYLEPFFEILEFPIFMGTTQAPQGEDIFQDQKWVLCAECGCLQILELIPLQILYSKEHSSGAIGEIWKNHHKMFANFILADSPESICEIGAAHCVLSEMILEKNPKTKYLIIEPNPLNIPKNVKLIPGFIEDNLIEISNYQAVVHSHVLEHIYDPRLFISNIANSMINNCAMYISFPNIARLIDTRGTNSLNFEHTYYLHPDQIKSLFRIYGLKVVREEEYLEHSYFFKVIKDNHLIINSKILNIADEAESFKKMWQELTLFVHSTNLLISKNPIPTFLFGAHIFSQGLISLGLDTKYIKGILDNSIDKQGERLYGSNLEVFSFEAIRNFSSVRVILKASHYQDEIRKQIISINLNAEIIE